MRLAQLALLLSSTIALALADSQEVDQYSSNRRSALPDPAADADANANNYHRACPSWNLTTFQVPFCDGIQMAGDLKTPPMYAGDKPLGCRSFDGHVVPESYLWNGDRTYFQLNLWKDKDCQGGGDNREPIGPRDMFCRSTPGYQSFEVVVPFGTTLPPGCE